jgi:hypothetical protein
VKPASLHRELVPHLPEALAPRSQLAWIEPLAEALPPVFSWGCYECRTGSDVGPVDFLVCSSDADGDREEVAEALAGPRAGGPLSGVEAALRAWGTSADAQAIPFLWLEFDAHRGPSAPVFFACADPRFGQLDGRTTPETRAVHATFAWMTHHLGLSGDLGPLIDRLVSGLPAGGQVLHLAPLASRGQHNQLRAVVAIPRFEVGPWLASLGLEPAITRGSGVARIHDWPQDHIGVHLDLTLHGPPSRVALQFHRNADEVDHWQAVLDTLVATTDLTAPQAEGVRQWLGRSTFWPGDGGWRIALDRGAELKIDLRSDGPDRVKAYLGFHAHLAFL